MIYGFFLELLMVWIFYMICKSFITYHDNNPVLVYLIWILVIYSIFLYEYITWFSDCYSVDF